MKNLGYLFVILGISLILVGCGQKTDDTVAPVDTPTTKISTTPATTTPATTVASTSVQPTVTMGSIADCSFLTLDDVKTAIGLDMKQAGSYPGTNGCSKSWIDLRTSMDATVALQVTKQAASSTQADLTMAAGTFEKVDKLGDYDTSWDNNGAAINFGKGDYKFQVQCMGDSCSKEKAVALANIVLTKTP
jgi:hypothetical protein